PRKREIPASEPETRARWGDLDSIPTPKADKTPIITEVQKPAETSETALKSAIGPINLSPSQIVSMSFAAFISLLIATFWWLFFSY
ncbi:MAG: hypothetical protein K2Z81_22885, partial [Cyanobacteria bacterium]|nr:hypothetical protein [Cyanobacteriota bacterium]